MRWRIAITVLAVIGIAAAVYVGTQPKKGTVEWHRREYFSTFEQVYGQRLIDRFRQATYRKTGWAWVRPKQSFEHRAQLRAKIQTHRKVLVESGYIVECQFSVTNTGAFKNRVSALIATSRTNRGDAWVKNARPFLTCTMKLFDEGTLVVTGPPEDISFWQDAVRQVDMAESK